MSQARCTRLLQRTWRAGNCHQSATRIRETLHYGSLNSPTCSCVSITLSDSWDFDNVFKWPAQIQTCHRCRLRWAARDCFSKISATATPIFANWSATESQPNGDRLKIRRCIQIMLPTSIRKTRRQSRGWSDPISLVFFPSYTRWSSKNDRLFSPRRLGVSFRPFKLVPCLTVSSHDKALGICTSAVWVLPAHHATVMWTSAPPRRLTFPTIVTDSSYADALLLFHVNRVSVLGPCPRNRC